MRRESFLRKYFKFNQKERYGTVILCFLILIAVSIRLFLPGKSVDKVMDVTVYEEEIASFYQLVHPTMEVGKDVKDSDNDVNETELFRFNPNNVSDKEFALLGLDNRQIRNIRNYQAKGGYFRNKEDFKKLYTIPSSLYDRLEPYLFITPSDAESKKNMDDPLSDENRNGIVSTDNSVTGSFLFTDINTADSSMLVQLKGIGPVLAARIIKYRLLIGGYVDINQLNDVYGITKELVSQLTPYLIADSSMIKKIPINNATFRMLAGHPYINRQIAEGVLKYRDLTGQIIGMDELLRNNLLTEEEAEKIRPYLSFNGNKISATTDDN